MVSSILRERNPIQSALDLRKSLEAEIFQEVWNGEYDQAYEMSQELLVDYASGENQSKELGRQRGVFAAVVNDFSSGHILVKVALSIFAVVQNPRLVSVIMLILAVGAYGLVWVFFLNFFKVIMRRMFLEARRYEAVPIYHLFFIPAVRRWRKASETMLITYLFQALWNLTIVGGIIKHYSYFCVPYIVGENPDIGHLEAITLSRKMMDGHKWECFLLDLQFLGWELLGVFTMELTSIFFSTPYRMAVFTEYYVHLRQMAKQTQIEGVHALNDRYLFTLASKEDLEWFYKDIVEDEAYLAENTVEIGSKQAFCAKWLSVWIGSSKKKKAWQKQRSLEVQVARERATMEQKCYPTRLHPLWPRGEKRLRSGRITYMRCYTGWSLVIMFFLFSAFGWTWEVMLHLLETGVYVNRGTLTGPWLPIYGAGGLMVLCLCTFARSRPIAELFSAMGLCAVLEYLTSFLLEMKHGLRWWDYTGYFLNLNGRICAEGILVFGIGSGIVVYLAAPVLDEMISRITSRIIVPVCTALLLVFGADLLYSHIHPNTGEGITNIEAGSSMAEDCDRNKKGAI